MRTSGGRSIRQIKAWRRCAANVRVFWRNKKQGAEYADTLAPRRPRKQWAANPYRAVHTTATLRIYSGPQARVVTTLIQLGYGPRLAGGRSVQSSKPSWAMCVHFGALAPQVPLGCDIQRWFPRTRDRTQRTMANVEGCWRAGFVGFRRRTD